jgi:hypothetical protein
VSSRVKRRKSALEALRLRLLNMQDYYVPVILKDEDCGVADYNGASPATPAERAQDRYYFCQALAITALLWMPVVLFVRTNGGQHPALLVVFKVPLKHYRENNHAFRVSQAIQQCQSSLPTFLAKQDVKRINSILPRHDQPSALPAFLQQQLENTLLVIATKLIMTKDAWPLYWSCLKTSTTGNLLSRFCWITDSCAQEDNRVEALLHSRCAGTSASMKYFTTTMGVQLMRSGEQLLHPLQRRHFIVPLFTQSAIWLTWQHKHLGKMS